MTESRLLTSPVPASANPTSQALSPRRPQQVFAGPSSPRPSRISMPSRLPSINASQALENNPSVANRTSMIMGFSPTPTSAVFSPFAESTGSGSSRPPNLVLASPIPQRFPLSPQLTSAIEQTFQVFPHDGSPRPNASSPRGGPSGEFPFRSRRNSSAVVSISLSSRSRSRTPRGSAAVLSGGSGHATPNKGSSTATPRSEETKAGPPEVVVQMADSWAPGVEEMEEWQPEGGILLDGGDSEVVEDEVDDGGALEGRTWTGVSDAERVVEDVLSPGTLFGEGMEFRGEVVQPAVGRWGTGADGDDVGVPLRRGGSEVGKTTRGDLRTESARKVYEVVRQLGSGSYAVVSLVRERGGRKREFALKCLSKQDLEEEQIETQLFEATIHLSLPIHTNIVTLHQTLQTKKWLFLMLELCPGEDLFFWLEKFRDASPPPVNAPLQDEYTTPMSSSKFSSSSIPFSSSQLFSGLSNHLSSSIASSSKPNFHCQQCASQGASPASLLFAHNNGSHSHSHTPTQTPPTPSLLSAFAASTLLSQRRLHLVASMFSQMCEAVAVCHDAGVSHRDIKPENFICCDSIELESVAEGEVDFGPQAKRKVIVKLTDFGLSTTEEESGDVECGSKPYMSYECRNNLGPTYRPSPADVWSLGIVFINMLFHRNPWKEPAPGDPNFDNFLRDPPGFLLSKFTGIGREIASYLAEHVLCTDVDDRVGAREFGEWIKGLPDMVGGRKAMSQLKMSRRDSKTPIEKGLFVKSPIESTHDRERKHTSSALTSSAPVAPALSHLFSPSQLALHSSTLRTPDLDRDDVMSATTIDEQPTPADMGDYQPPESVDDESTTRGDADSRSLSTHKRRKRGVRKGKAAQAALAAAAAGEPSQEERDSLLAELAEASQLLARDLSKNRSYPDFDRIEEFPPLGTSPAQVAAAKKSKWKDLMKLSSGNPELAALARRVADRDASSGGNWSAPAMLQHDANRMVLSKPGFKHTATMSSGVSSALSSFGPVSSATSSSGGVEEDEWRRTRDGEDPLRGRQSANGQTSRQDDESASRARKDALAAAAITGNMDPMGSFGKGPIAKRNGVSSSNPPDSLSYAVRSSVATGAQRVAPRSNLALESIVDEDYRPSRSKSAVTSAPSHPVHTSQDTYSTNDIRPTLSSTEWSFKISNPIPVTASTPSPGPSPNKPKLKGQIQSLAKMLSGLKTKGKD